MESRLDFWVGIWDMDLVLWVELMLHMGTAMNVSYNGLDLKWNWKYRYVTNLYFGK
jgi:hypothetical protein